MYYVLCELHEPRSMLEQLILWEIWGFTNYPFSGNIKPIII